MSVLQVDSQDTDLKKGSQASSQSMSQAPNTEDPTIPSMQLN